MGIPVANREDKGLGNLSELSFCKPAEQCGAQPAGHKHQWIPSNQRPIESSQAFTAHVALRGKRVEASASTSDRVVKPAPALPLPDPATLSASALLLLFSPLPLPASALGGVVLIVGLCLGLVVLLLELRLQS